MRRLTNTESAKHFRQFYNFLLHKACETFIQGDDEKTLQAVSNTARLAWFYHPGVFSEPKLENIILEIGTRLKSSARATSLPLFQNLDTTEKNKRILHVATEVYGLGGHSRLITSWIKNDLTNNHSLIVTNQEANTIPKEFKKIVNQCGGEFLVLPKEESLLKRAAMLRETSRQFGFVILHQHPDDVIPPVAFAVNNTPPVGLMNHADHVFWLGASISDLVIELRSFGVELTANRRKGRKSLILPIPITLQDCEITREQARQSLSLEDDQVVLLSIGSEYKYAKNKSHDFSLTAQKILDANPQAVLYVVGPQNNSKKFQTHKRMKFLGVIKDLTTYHLAADIYLEGFPFSSFTALLETVVHNVCPILMYSPCQIAAFEREMGLTSCEPQADNEDNYIKQVSELINNKDKRHKIAAQVKKDVIDYHIGEKWHQHLHFIYDYLKKTMHQPQQIPETASLMQIEDNFLIEMTNSQFQFMRSPIWLEMCAQPEILKSLSYIEIFTLFCKSWRGNDTKSLLDIIRWRHTFKLS